jgi:putative endonuclease
MKYAYTLQNIAEPDHFYSGIVEYLKAPLARHNTKAVPDTSKHAPSRLKSDVAFSGEKQAFAFDSYLKTASGGALTHTDVART